MFFYLLTHLIFFFKSNKAQFGSGLNLNIVVPGNWSTISSSDDTKRILYFIRLGNRKYQALLDDNFFTVNVTNPTRCVINWTSYIIPLTFSNYSTNHYITHTELEGTNLALQVEFFSPKAVEILLIDKEQRKFHSWFLTKDTLPQLTKTDLFKAILFLISVVYLVQRLNQSIKLSANTRHNEQMTNG